MSAHARLSPSSAERWLQCPGSVRLVEASGSEGESSVYADEGTKAHTVAEIVASLRLGLTNKTEYLRRLKSWKADTPEDWHADQLAHAREYADLLFDLVQQHEHAQVMLEQRLNTGVLGCWGTGDAVIVTPDLVHVVDYKYGQGVPVNAYENPQLMLYGLGGLETFGLLGHIRTVAVTVFQPRLDSKSTYTISAVELRNWRDSVVAPTADLALSGAGHLSPSEKACRWCPVSGECKVRAEYVTRRDFGHPDLLSPEELADMLGRASEIRAWCKDVEETALRKAYHEGIELPGWKVVRSGGKRVVTNPEKAVDRLAEAGYPTRDLWRKSLVTLADLDRLVGGKEVLQEILDDCLVKQPGREALVPEHDPRPPIDAMAQAKKDFSPNGRDESEVE